MQCVGKIRGATRSGVGRRHFSGTLAAAQDFFIHEVTPRDGLQNEPSILDGGQKLKLIEGLVKANPASVEVCSFVREDRVPTMRGSKELVTQLGQEQWAVEAKAQGMHFAALTPNRRGFETFQSVAGDILDTVVVLTSSTESHSKANVGMSMPKALETTCDIIRDARAEGFRVLAFASLAFGCPFEGKVDPAVVKDIVDAYAELDVSRIVLADTQGVGRPEQVDELMALFPDIPRDMMALHMHDTHSKAHLNIAAGIRQGIRHFDSATGGCGGCNFAPGALGNISTQKLLRTIEAEVNTGETTALHGMDHAVIQEVHTELEIALGSKLPFSYGLAT